MGFFMFSDAKLQKYCVPLMNFVKNLIISAVKVVLQSPMLGVNMLFCYI